MNDRYSIKAPISSHWRQAGCEEVDCRQYEYGWETHCATGTDLGKKQIAYLRSGDSGRRFTERMDVDGILIFKFPPGEQCFRDHIKKMEEKGHLLLRESNGQRQLLESDRWLWDFNESMEKHRR